MNWSVRYRESEIDIFYLSYSKGSYNLLPPGYCKVCAYPKPEKDECPWRSSHPKFLKRIYAIGPYYKTRILHETGESDTLSRDIYFLKRNAQKAEPLALAMGVCMEHRYPELLKYDLLVAVPQHEDELHIDEYTGDAFNQVDPLVEWLSKTSHIPVVTPLIKTRPQSMEKLGWIERKKVTKDLYKCRGKGFTGKNIILIDDVATTGSNLESCAEELLSKGAGVVMGFVCGKDYVG